MDARSFAKTRNYMNEAKYEAQLYWCAIISLVLALALGFSSTKEENPMTPRMQVSHHSENGYSSSHSQGGT
ncbi:MAG: hypothetical protein AB1540_08480 [Bdellovibrionota bacterium]